MNPLFAELVTHLIAFGLFAWILKKFAWGPIMEVLDRRREHIGELIKRAKDAEQEAQETQELFSMRRKQLEDQSHEKLQDAIRQGEREAVKLTDKARTEAGEILAQARLSAKREAKRAKKELQKEVAHLAVKVARQTLGDVVDAPLQKRLLKNATKNLSAATKGPSLTGPKGSLAS